MRSCRFYGEDSPSAPTANATQYTQTCHQNTHRAVHAARRDAAEGAVKIARTARPAPHSNTKNLLKKRPP